MGNRLSKIVTRTGDGGSTGLATGERVAKSSLRVGAIGDVDELNCAIGLLLEAAGDGPEGEHLRPVQHELFDLGGELALPGAALIGEAQVLALEDSIERLNAELPPLKEFVLPGGGEAAARAHAARAVCRRAERGLWRLHESEPVGEAALRYLNRLSDLLFVVARRLARAGRGEISWTKQSRA